jgi:hypothetical protein
MWNWKMGLALVAACAVICVSVVLSKPEQLPKPPTKIVSTVYKGSVKTDLATYRVEVRENWDSNTRTTYRIVHLYPGKSSLVSITGQDGTCLGSWDRIFYCGYHLNGASGANSVERTDTGWYFEACGADEGKVQPFSDQEILSAAAELNLAMREVYNQDHITEQFVWNGAQEMVKTIDKPN